MTAVLEQSLGVDASTTREFTDMRWGVGVWTGAPGEAKRDAVYFRARLYDALGLVDAAIYQLELTTAPAALEGANYDPGLWDEVKHSVEEERWQQVASAAVIYLEDKVRRWAGTPLDPNGKKLVGHALLVRALSPDGPLVLGSQPNETEGWRNLGTGLTAAVSNVVRHGIDDRPDGRRYALGVLGLVSLLLTQIRYEHPDAQ
ncbi:TIGR02391 family protein [Cellulomonas soli]